MSFRRKIRAVRAEKDLRRRRVAWNETTEPHARAVIVIGAATIITKISNRPVVDPHGGIPSVIVVGVDRHGQADIFQIACADHPLG